MSEKELRCGLLHGSGGKIELEESLVEFLRSHGFHDAADDVRRCLDGMYDGDGSDDMEGSYNLACDVISAIEKATEREGTEEEKLATIEKIIDDWNGGE